MKHSKIFSHLFPFMMMSIPWIYLGMIWNRLPQVIPTHFGLEGTPDAFGSKNELLVIPLIFSILGILVYYLLLNIHKIDPKKKYNSTTASVLSKLAVAVVLLMTIIPLLIFFWTLKGKVEGLSILFCSISLLFTYMGNLFHSIKPNYFVGFRLPWTLENEENWRKTHQLASKFWFFGGIFLALVSILFEEMVLFIIFMSTLMIMILVPVFYSYNIYRRSQKNVS